MTFHLHLPSPRQNRASAASERKLEWRQVFPWQHNHFHVFVQNGKKLKIGTFLNVEQWISKL
jgi:hypothetical protein